MRRRHMSGFGGHGSIADSDRFFSYETPREYYRFEGNHLTFTSPLETLIPKTISSMRTSSRRRSTAAGPYSSCPSGIPTRRVTWGFARC